MAVSILEYWDGDSWEEAQTNSSQNALVRVDITDKLGNPRVAKVTLLNPSAEPFGSGDDRFGPLTGIFTDFLPIRIIETDSNVVLFAGKVYSEKQEYDLGFGQVIKLYARDNLAELADFPTDDKNILIESDGTVNTRSKVIQKIINDSGSPPHSSSLMISTANILTNDTQKFETSARVFKETGTEFNVASLGKQGLQVIAEIAHNDVHEANSVPAKDFGYDYYVDTQYTTTAGTDNPAADFNYFKRGTRTKFQATATNFDGLTVEYPVSSTFAADRLAFKHANETTGAGKLIPMLAEYDFHKPPTDLYTGATVSLSNEYKDANDATLTDNASLDFEIIEGTPNEAFIHADPTESTSAWEGKAWARLRGDNAVPKEVADYLWKFGVNTDTGARINDGDDINSSVTTITIDGSNTIKAGDIIMIDTENMYVTAISPTTNPTSLTVIRGWGGTHASYSGAASHSDNDIIYTHPIVGRLQYQSTNSGDGFILISFENDLTDRDARSQKVNFESIATGGSDVVLTNGNHTFTFTPDDDRPMKKYGIQKPLRLSGNAVKNVDIVRERIASSLTRAKGTRTDCVVNTTPPPFIYIETGELSSSATAASATQVTLVAPVGRTAWDIGLRVGMTIAKVDSTGTQTAYGYVTAIADTSSTVATITAALNTGNWTNYTSSDRATNRLRFYIPVRAGHYIRANNVLVNFEGYMFVKEAIYTQQAGAQVTMYKGTGVNTAGTTIGQGIEPNSIKAAVAGEAQKYARFMNVPMGGLGWSFRDLDATNSAIFTPTNQTTMAWTGGEFSIGQMKKFKVRAGNVAMVTTVDSNTSYPILYKVYFDPDQNPDANGTFTFTFTREDSYYPDMDHVIIGHARAGISASHKAIIIRDSSGTGLFGGRDGAGEGAFSTALLKKTVQPWSTDLVLYAGTTTSTGSTPATPANTDTYIHGTSGALGTGVDGNIKWTDETTTTINAGNTSELTGSQGDVYYIFFKLVDSGGSETSEPSEINHAVLDRTNAYENATSASRGLLAIATRGGGSGDTLQTVGIVPFHGKGLNINADHIAARSIVSESIRASEALEAFNSDIGTGVTVSSAGAIYTTVSTTDKVYGDDNVGYILENASGNTPRFQFGANNGDHIKYTSGVLTITGDIEAGSTVTIGENTDSPSTGQFNMLDNADNRGFRLRIPLGQTNMDIESRPLIITVGGAGSNVTVDNTTWSRPENFVAPGVQYTYLGDIRDSDGFRDFGSGWKALVLQATATDGGTTVHDGTLVLRAHSTTTNQYVFSFPQTNGSDGEQLTDDGTGQTSWAAASSSLRYKENIRPLEIDSSKIYNLDPKSFNLIEGHVSTLGNAKFGYIAEEVDKILPEVVRYDKEDRPDALNYQLLTVFLIEEIKKLKTRIETLEAM